MCQVPKTNAGLAHALFDIPLSDSLDNPGYTTFDYLGSPYDLFRLDVHAGIDFRSKNGTNTGLDTVYSVVSGKVVKAENGTGFGQVGIQRTDKNNQTILFSYAHLNSTNLKVGDTVKVGDVIGKTGKTGTSSPHLHVEYRTNYTGSSLIGGASCGSTCSESDIISKTKNPVDIIDLECGKTMEHNQNYGKLMKISWFLNGNKKEIIPKGYSGKVLKLFTWWGNHSIKLDINNNGNFEFDFNEDYPTKDVWNNSDVNLSFSNGFSMQDYELWNDYWTDDTHGEIRCWYSDCSDNPYGAGALILLDDDKFSCDNNIWHYNGNPVSEEELYCREFNISDETKAYFNIK